MNDVNNAKYIYLPNDPTRYTVELSMAWVDYTTKAAIHSAYQNTTTWGISGISGICVNYNLNSQLPEWGINNTAVYFDGNVVLQSYNPYAYRTTAVRYNYLPKNSGWVADVSFAWSDNTLKNTINTAAISGGYITVGPVSGYCVSASVQPMVADWGVENATYWQGSTQLLSYDPFALRITNAQVSGPKGATYQSLAGTSVIQYGYTGKVGRDVQVSTVWVPSSVVQGWITSQDSFTPITISGRTMYISPNNGLQIQPSVPELDFTNSQYYHVTITGVLSTGITGVF